MDADTLRTVEAEWGGPPEEGEHSQAEAAAGESPTAVTPLAAPAPQGANHCRTDPSDLHERPLPDSPEVRALEARARLRRMLERLVDVTAELSRLVDRRAAIEKAVRQELRAQCVSLPVQVGGHVLLDGGAVLHALPVTRLD